MVAKTALVSGLVRRLGLEKVLAQSLERIGERAVAAKVQNYVSSSNSEKTWGEGGLEQLLGWICERLGGWLERAGGEKAPPRATLEAHFFKSFLEARSEQIYELILDYPASTPALRPLKACLELSGEHALLRDALLRQLKARLLVPSLHTPSIIGVFVNALKVLRLLEPTGGTQLLEPVVALFRSYLAKRADAGGAVVALITDKASVLHQDLPKKYRLAGGEAGFQSDEDEQAAREWRPRFTHREIGSGGGSLGRLTAVLERGAGGTGSGGTWDALSVLIGVVGGKEHFLEEYCRLLADKLVTRDREGYREEKLNVEFLKQRFGEAALLRADVMLRDFVESRRFQKALPDGGPVEPVVCSRFFWPLPAEDAPGFFNPPEPMASLHTEVAQKYAEKKKLRRFALVPQQGQVTLELEFADGSSRPFQVRPLQAAIISLFDGGNLSDNLDARLALSEICERLEADLEDVQKEILFWVHAAVLREVEPGLYANAS